MRSLYLRFCFLLIYKTFAPSWAHLTIEFEYDARLGRSGSNMRNFSCGKTAINFFCFVLFFCIEIFIFQLLFQNVQKGKCTWRKNLLAQKLFQDCSHFVLISNTYGLIDKTSNYLGKEWKNCASLKVFEMKLLFQI